MRLSVAAAIAVAVAALLVAAPTTVAKEIQGGRVCGAEGCRSTGALPIEASSLSPPGTDLPTPEPWYRIRLRMGAGGQALDTFRVLWAPGQKLIAYDERNPRWWPAPPAAVRIARRITRGVTPYPAATMPMHFVPVRIDEVVGPAARPAGATGARSGDGGGLPWVPIAAAAAAVLAGGLAAGRYRSRRANPRSASAPTSAT